MRYNLLLLSQEVTIDCRTFHDLLMSKLRMDTIQNLGGLVKTLYR